MSLYKEVILDHYRHPRNFGQLKKPTKSVTLDNPLCGDKIRIDLLLKSDQVEKVKFSGQGCAISQASASMLTEYAKGKSISDLIKLEPSSMLKMLAINLSPTRLKCALLPLEALQQCLIK